jgi:hypoxanthine phosphoribosyltransferase
LVGVLKGSFVFLADLVRELTIPFEVDFVLARSYGLGTSSTGKVEILKEVESNVRDRHVVVIEDIADTGLTLDAVVSRIEAGSPASVKRCALLVREGHPSIDFAGLLVGSGFLVGYGIDYAERYRGLRDIHALVEETTS